MTTVFIPTPIDHGTLSGLTDDDHAQYLLVSGARAMTGHLNMGGFSITSVDLVDGVDVSTHGSRHAAAGLDPLQVSAGGVALGRAVGAGAGAVQELTGDQLGAILDAAGEYLRQDGTTTLTGPWDAGAHDVTLRAFLHLNSATPTARLGDATGSPNEIFDKADAGSEFIGWQNVGTYRWVDWVLSNENKSTERRDAAGVNVNFPVTHNATDTLAGTVTTLADATIQETNANILHVWGNSLGAPVLRTQKDEAAQTQFTHYSEGVLRWLDLVGTDEAWSRQRYSTAAAFVNSPLHFTAADDAANTQTTLADATIFFSRPSAFFVMGDGTASPEFERRKSDAGAFADEWCIGSSARWQIVFNTDESFHSRRINTDGSTIVNDPIRHVHTNTLSATETRYQDATHAFNYPSVIAVFGDATGEPRTARNKDEASGAYDIFRKESLDWWAWEFGTTEYLALQRRGDGGAFVNYPILWNDATTVAASTTTFGDATVALSVADVTLILGTNGGSPGLDGYKVGSGTYRHSWFSDNVLRAQTLLDSAEDFYIKKLTSGAALETEIALFASGYNRFQTHVAWTDGITLPSATSGYAKHAVDTADGNAKIIYGDGAKATYALDIDSQTVATVHRMTSAVSISNGTQTDLISYTVPGGTLGANGWLRCTLFGRLAEDTGTVRLRISLGGTEIYSDTFGLNEIASPVLSHLIGITFVIKCRNSASTLRTDGKVTITPIGTTTTGYGDLGSIPTRLVDTEIGSDVGVDTASDRTLAVTWQYTVGPNDGSVTFETGFVELSPTA